MSFRDVIPRCVKSKIQSWGLSNALLKELLTALRFELQTRKPEEYTRNIVAPVRTRFGAYCSRS